MTRRHVLLSACLIAIGLLSVAGVAAGADYRIGFLYLGLLVIAAWWLDRPFCVQPNSSARYA